MTATVNLDEYQIVGQYSHVIGVWTCGLMAMGSEVCEAIEKAFNGAPKGDWFYSINIGELKCFVAENGEFGYTAMLAGEY
jgi:hypothetical protein